MDADGTLECYKARLVTQGCTQKFGLDYEETFSPVVHFESIRYLLAMGTLHKLHLHQMDVSTAFLHGELSEEVYMRQPEGFVEPGEEMIIYKDNQSTICLAKNQTVHGRTKYISIKYHFIRDLVEAGKIKLMYCAIENVVADMFTKKFSIRQFEKLQHLIGVTESNQQSK